MSKVAIEGNAAGTGTFTIASPNSNTSQTLTLPDATGTVVLDTTLFTSNTQTFNASGTWTKPAGGSMARIQVWGGGGGGARDSSSSVCTGGGGGGYSEIIVPLSSLNSTETVTVGAGGTGRTGSSGSGTVGGNSFFGSVCSAYGGGNGRDNDSFVGGGGPLGAGSSALLTGNLSYSSIVGAPSLAPASYAFGNNSNVGRWYSIPSPFHGGITGVVTIACESTYILQVGSIYGGGSGGYAESTASTTGASSVYGGNGGNGGRSATGFNGVTPAGGGGGRNNNLNGGDGGSGRVIVTVF